MSSQQRFTTASSPEIRITTATHFHPAMSPASLKSEDLQESDVMICRAQRVPLQVAVGKLVSSSQTSHIPFLPPEQRSPLPLPRNLVHRFSMISPQTELSFPSTVYNMGQQDLIRTCNDNKGITSSKNPGLYLSVPENPMKYQVSVELGSPFTANKFLNFQSDSLFRGRIDIRTTFPLNFSSSPYDSPESHTDSQDEEEDITEDANEDTQCIYIPSTSPFYRPPRKACLFASSSSNISFSCAALPEDRSFQTQSATSFYESPPPASDEWKEAEHSKSTLCLHQKHDQDLSFSPVKIYEENRFSPTSQVAIYLKVLEMAASKPLPDVPRGIDFEYDYEEYDSESSCSSSDLEEERKEGRVCPIDAAPPLDLHLVAPFEHYGHRNLRASIVPKTSFCGLF
ncbi:hypothetical protein F5876DRAFT_77265 [Lentinula aff. lateritia]|uniref:Uncharacterized protein n=1 Tax=Lentinula aff. lateritia TaxID=2804960 RepID=A0ACC1TZA3_9AGAR|nr:hypothetical protein F5876DRAFT_77265 [Lentinula aff. lateritia]